MSALDIEQIDGVPIAHVNQDIDVANAAAIRQQLADMLDPDALSIVVDLSATQYVDSAGVDMLLRLSDLLDHRRAELILVIPDTSQLMRLAMVVGLPEAIAVHPSLTAAVQEAARAQAQTTGHDPIERGRRGLALSAFRRSPPRAASLVNRLEFDSGAVVCLRTTNVEVHPCSGRRTITSAPSGDANSAFGPASA